MSTETGRKLTVRYSKYKIDGLDKVGKANLNANIASTLQAGCFAGCFIASWASDKWGRKIALQIAGLVTIVGCVMQACAMGSLEAMYIGRFIAGLGVGGASMVVPLYISENAPRGIRGGLTGLYQLFIATGEPSPFIYDEYTGRRDVSKQEKKGREEKIAFLNRRPPPPIHTQ